MASMIPGAAASTTGKAFTNRPKNDLLFVGMSVPFAISARLANVKEHSTNSPG
jgi:hypothetical protein